MARGPAMNGRSSVLPTGTEVASYKSYQDAVAAVEILSTADFPLPTVAIVGSDLHIAETVMGKLTPGRVAFAGASQGVTWGLLMGLMALILVPEYSPVAPIMAVVAGIVAGTLMAVISWATNKESRSFAAQSQLVASRYAVLVSEQTEKAFKLLQSSTGNLSNRPKTRVRTAPSAPNAFGAGADESPKFGIRLTPTERQNQAAEPPKPKVTAETQADSGE